jgi:HEAT repeat protein
MTENLKTSPSVEPPKPSEADVVQALVEIEQATKGAPAKSGTTPPDSGMETSWHFGNAQVALYLVCVFVLIASLAWGAQFALKKLLAHSAERSGGNGGVAIHHTTDAAKQAQAEGLLERASAGDLAAANQILEQSDSWTGKTQRTPKTDQFLTAGINFKDMNVRAAALQAQLALEGIPRDESGRNTLEQAVGNPQRRSWALWMLGALGNRGVDPEHTAKIMESYLDDPNVQVRASAVEGLALLATDETVPMLLDRFRNDPSTVVQERAACGLAESGMYTHQQRLIAAASMVGWLDDSLLSQQQRSWTAQALHDISGQNFGTDSAAWRRWYESAR